MSLRALTCLAEGLSLASSTPRTCTGIRVGAQRGASEEPDLRCIGRFITTIGISLSTCLPACLPAHLLACLRLRRLHALRWLHSAGLQCLVVRLELRSLMPPYLYGYGWVGEGRDMLVPTSVPTWPLIDLSLSTRPVRSWKSKRHASRCCS